MKPITNRELFLGDISGDYSGELPKPNTREEIYLGKIASGGGGGGGGGSVDVDTQMNPESTNPVQNQAIYAFVNSSVSTNTANFIGTFESVAALEAYSGTVTNNDYAFVVGTDNAGNTKYDRYKYIKNTVSAAWTYEYTLNNSSFTAAEWETIQSGLTADDKTKYDGYAAAIADKVDKEAGKDLSSNDYTTAEKQKLAGLSNYDDTEVRGLISEKQDTISDLSTIRSGAASGATAVQPDALATSLLGKVDKEAGKSLSSNDYTTAEKQKLAGLSNYNDAEIRSMISEKQDVIEDLSDIRSGAGAGSTAVQPADMTTALAGKQDTISDLSTIREGASAGATAVQPADLSSAISGKQDRLTFDKSPTARSTNPVESGGVYTSLGNKQDVIEDLSTIRSGASAGATAVQPGELSTALNGKVDRMTGYGLSSNDYTTAEKQKLAGLSNYDDTEVRDLISGKQDTISDLAAIRSGAASGATAVQTIKINGTTQTKTNGTVNLPAYPTKSSLGLGNVDNTSDLSKPISTAVQADQQRQDIVIADTVRSGRKNKFKNTASSGQMGNVRLTVNADGSILADGVAQDKKATGNIYFDIGTISSDSEIFDGNHFLCGFPSTAAGGMLYISMGSYTQRDYGSGVALPTTSETGTATVRVYFGTGTVVDNVLIKPMICLKSAFDMSPEFQPYAPTNRELYEMILALQNGGTT